jgi:hypothetical protein
MAQDAETRSQVCAFLRHLYTVPHDHEFVEQMQDGGMAAAFNALPVEEMPEVIHQALARDTHIGGTESSHLCKCGHP